MDLQEYDISVLLENCRQSGSYDVDKIERAYRLAERLHDGQKRISGEPYIVHPLAVASIVFDCQLDTDSICAAFLHDTVEDCADKITLAEIREQFGNDVADIVDGVTKLNIPFETKEETSIRNLRKMFFAMSKDLRVIFVKLADRLHNMRTLSVRSPEKQRSIALETMHVYAPIAHRLGMQMIKQELETLALKYLDPIGFQEIERYTEKRYGESKDFLNEATQKVADSLKAYGISFQMEGRVKSTYSIYKKMYNQNKSFDEIYDFYALRVFVDTELDCYTVLGIIHEKFNSIPGRFKDYISTPKQNMYRSLHTTVIGSEGIPFEVQIRTWEMHEIAEYGLAAHWKYKSGEKGSQSMDEKLKWIRSLLDADSEGADPDEFMQALKVDLFEDEIFVFTPRGDVINLPSGSNPIDFAYAIHSAVGNKMVGAKVNGNIVPIDTELQTGEIVEVLTNPSSKGPSRDWLKLVRSSEAKSKIKMFFKKEMRTENIEIGKQEVDRELRRYRTPYTEAQRDETVRNLADRMGFADALDVYNAIGYNGVDIDKIAARLKEEFVRIVQPADPERENPESYITDAAVTERKEREDRKKKKSSESVIVDNVTGCAVKFAKCCSPLPGDRIIGFITKGYGISIHKYDCVNVQKSLQKEDMMDRWVTASWTGRAEKRDMGGFAAFLNVYATYTPSIIADVTLALRDMKVELMAMTTKVTGDTMIINCGVRCRDSEHAALIMSALRKVKDVFDVTRGN
ncbi:MAG: bifunctional (p)ppGpp synthetase/guanosine-3',5'-bis(diphosphate) 3'-pyrophosphohydrolase, partial [Clostridia bacterium]|nr:bifunctional (p)ppGpp synthetase/guanosine-3',5'-bis(diphosphate) 3'-pyrophosphohydrolase [Clostridia bacterium]